MAYRMPVETESESRFRKRVERANQARFEQERRQHDIVSMRIAQREFEGKMQRMDERLNFDLYLLALRNLMLLEILRDANEPKSPDDPWNETFCTAVRLIPEAKMFLEEMSIKCIRSEQ